MEFHNNNNNNNQEEIPQNLIVKLKLPKYQENIIAPPPPPPPQEEEPPSAAVEVEDGVEEVKLHICPSCNKGFKSRKALGVHSMAHQPPPPQQPPPQLESNTELNNNDNNNNNNDDDNNIEEVEQVVMNVKTFKCKFCPKEFPTNKSLYGHLRTHPSKTRGKMKHPPTAAVSRLRRLGTWSLTAKRGRKSWLSTSATTTTTATISSSSLSAASLEEDEAVAAAETLMFLARGGYGNGNRHAYDYDYDYDFLDDNVEVKKARKDNNNNNDNHDYEEGEEVIKGVNDPISPLLSTTFSKFKGIKKVNHKSNSTNFDSMVTNQEIINKWICITCGKSFPTHQALGGHRSSHNKDKYNGQARVVDFIDKGGDRGGGGGQGSRVVVNASNDDEAEVVVLVSTDVHKCKFCEKSFASGQALGGHQRCHYMASSDYSSGQSSSQTGQTNIKLIIDLNLEPPSMMEDDYGDVSVVSTFNNKHCL
ncbi:hypothetical protein vseg_009662 [Gypsophila vaccaria]